MQNVQNIQHMQNMQKMTKGAEYAENTEYANLLKQSMPGSVVPLTMFKQVDWTNV